ncbi:MAG: cob(I)yrinic acid a,c-diamide adenosyltransferase [Armatimonadetes bacterium]|nr:cob(I)yrinic acid a,c-diamide adenosyltransferase [Armatimonadota bacterium]
MKIYTKTGDKGETGLIGGKRIGKDSLRIEAYGNVDELNAALGLAASLSGDEALNSSVRAIQDELFTMGADLASPDRKEAGGKEIPKIGSAQVEGLELIIDSLSMEIPPLRNFILPTGNPAVCALHLARSIARRAERSVVALSRVEPVNPEVVKYLNRLSDILFVMARVALFRKGIPEVPPSYT